MYKEHVGQCYWSAYMEFHFSLTETVKKTIFALIPPTHTLFLSVSFLRDTLLFLIFAQRLPSQDITEIFIHQCLVQHSF